MSGAHRPPFYQLLGLQYPVDGGALVLLPAAAGLLNSKGHVHGGAIMTLADAALSRCVRLARPETAALSTVSISCSFSAPAQGSLHGYAEYLGGGRSVVTATFTVRDDTGAVVAAGVGSLRIFPRQESAPMT